MTHEEIAKYIRGLDVDTIRLLKAIIGTIALPWREEETSRETQRWVRHNLDGDIVANVYEQVSYYGISAPTRKRGKRVPGTEQYVVRPCGGKQNLRGVQRTYREGCAVADLLLREKGHLLLGDDASEDCPLDSLDTYPLSKEASD